MPKTTIETLLADQVSRKVLLILKNAIDVALNGKPRKRGRPKKGAVAVASENGEPKRKRGRPKKVEATGSPQEHERVAAGRGHEVVAQL